MKKQISKSEISLALKSDNAVISKDNENAGILEISITPPEKGLSNERALLNISLVLDRSGSMSGENVHYVKEAARHVIDLLDEKDRASIVVYDDRVETLVHNCCIIKRGHKIVYADFNFI